MYKYVENELTLFTYKQIENPRFIFSDLPTFPHVNNKKRVFRNS